MGIQVASLTRLSAGKALAGVQAARGAAALMVVIYHTTRSLSLPQYLGRIPFDNAFGFGHAGVDFFFVLSGFIITHAHATDVGCPKRLYRYLWRRVTRIYPIYWLCLSLEILRSLFATDAASRLAFSHLLHSFFLLPEDTWPLVSVAWTLRSEMLFYLVFALTILSRRICLPLIFGALLLVAIGAPVGSAGPWVDLLTSPFNIQFLIGITVAVLVVHLHVPHPAVCAAVGVIAFLMVGALEVRGVILLNGLTPRLLYGSASGLILLGLVEMEKRGIVRFARPAVILGDASYCLYLIHLTIIPPVVRSFAYLGVLGVVPSGLVVAALVGLSVVIAVALHVRVERPMMALIRSRTPRLFR